MTETGLPAGVDPRVRVATPADVASIVGLVRDLASYERAEADALMTPAQLTDALFGPDPALFGLVASVEGDIEVVGFAVYFLNFSTWRGVHGIYLEDLYVREEHRGSGLGRALLQALAVLAVDRGYARVEWSVLDWNEPSIGFYRSIGAVGLDEWTTMRLTDDALTRFAATS